jgi:hypothetical protein
VFVVVQETLAQFGHRDRLECGSHRDWTASVLSVSLGRQPRRFGLRLADPDADRACTLAVIEIPRAVMQVIRDVAYSPAARGAFAPV